MNKTIGENSSQLNDLFESVRRDTPEITREELATLIATEPSSRIPSMRHNTILLIRKGIVMSLVTALIVGAAYLLLAPSQNHEAFTALSSNKGSNEALVGPPSQAPHERLLQNSTATEDTEQPAQKKPEVIDPRRWQIFIHKPIDLSSFTLKELDPDRFAALGLVQTDSGEVIYYHRSFKIGFPVQDYIFSYEDGEDDPNLKILGSRPFYAQYVTDSRGNMMVHYEVKELKNGSSVSYGTYDRDLSKELKNLKYFGISFSSTRQQLFADTVNDILKIQLYVKAGIMRGDTILIGKISDQRSIDKSQREMQIRLRTQDSVLKMSLGGMDAIAQNYVFDISNTTDPLVKKVISEFGKIKTKGKNPLEIISEKLAAAGALMEMEETVGGKLRLEQLMIKLSYEAYVEKNKLDAAELQNPVDLIPVRIRAATGQKFNPHFDNGLIFWFRDSDSLREALDLPMSTVNRNESIHALTVSPNPAILYLYVDYEIAQTGPARITLLDLTGKQVFSDAWNATERSGRKEINVQTFAAGIYIMVMETEKGSMTRQVVVRKL